MGYVNTNRVRISQAYGAGFARTIRNLQSLCQCQANWVDVVLLFKLTLVVS